MPFISDLLSHSENSSSEDENSDSEEEVAPLPVKAPKKRPPSKPRAPLKPKPKPGAKNYQNGGSVSKNATHRGSSSKLKPSRTSSRSSRRSSESSVISILSEYSDEEPNRNKRPKSAAPVRPPPKRLPTHKQKPTKRPTAAPPRPKPRPRPRPKSKKKYVKSNKFADSKLKTGVVRIRKRIIVENLVQKYIEEGLIIDKSRTRFFNCIKDFAPMFEEDDDITVLSDNDENDSDVVLSSFSCDEDSEKEAEKPKPLIPCSICKSTLRQDLIVSCFQCKLSFHSTCLVPRRLAPPKPELKWYCGECAQEKLIENMEEALEQYKVVYYKMRSRIRREELKERWKEEKVVCVGTRTRKKRVNYVFDENDDNEDERDAHDDDFEESDNDVDDDDEDNDNGNESEEDEVVEVESDDENKRRSSRIKEAKHN